MITRAVSNVGDPLVAPDGTPAAHVKVTFTLLSTNRQTGDVFDALTGERVTGMVSAITDVNGEFTANLWPNDRGATVTQYLCHVDLTSVADFKASVPSGATTLTWVAFMAQGATLTPQQIAEVEYVAHRDASGGYAGLTGYAINLWNAAKTFKTLLTFNGTANRVHTFQDRNGTIADDTDLAGKANVANGVTNGDSHDHSGGDGAQIAHGSLSGSGTNTHAQIDTHISSKDASGGYAGLTLFKINFKNAANTFTSFLTNANTAARTYTFQDRDGTIADNTDLALKAALAGSATQDFAAKSLTVASNATLGDSAIFDAHTINGKSTANDIRLTAVTASLPTLTFVDACFHLAKDDTDKGAWRKRKGQSWRSEARSAGKYLGVYSTATTAVAAGGALTDVYYNTTNLRFEEITATGTPASTVTYRAGREDYPTNALITAEAARVIIWDLDGAVPSMCGVLPNSFGTITSIASAGPILAIGSSTGEWDYGFLRETYRRRNTTNLQHYSKGSFTALGTATTTETAGAIVNATVNDVAITVLPDAMIDEYGMPIPNIAVATAGGISEIQNDGTVKNSLSTTAAYGISYDDLNRIRWNTTTEYNCSPVAPRAASFTASSATEPKLSAAAYSTSNVPISPAIATATGKSVKGAIASTNGLTIYRAGQSANALHAAITSTYNTGYMVGDIRRAWLSDNLSGTIVDTELVTNGTFTTDTTGWTSSNGSTLSVVSGTLRVTKSTTAYGDAYQSFTTVVGKSYQLVFTIASGTAGGYVSCGVGSGSGKAYLANATASGSATFIATTTTTGVYIQVNDATTALTYCDFDNISVKEVSADRSIKAKPLSVVGTLTRTAYTGGRTVYSGFSAANYFQEASHADWNALGAGDFSIIMSGVKWGTAATLKTILSMGDGASNGSVKVEHLVANTLRVSIYNAGWTTICTSTATFTDTAEHVVEIKRYTQSGVASTVAIVVDGMVVASAVSVLTISNATGYLRIGEGQDASQPWAGGFCACVRISATAPTAEQSKYIAAAENALNGGNACLLSNSSSVSALSYDKDTDSLFVGNGTNVDTFNGLKRIASQAHGVTTLTSVASINGSKLIAGTGASYTAPERNISAELLEAQTTKPRTQNYSFTSAAVTQALPAGWKAQGVLFNLTDGTMSSASQTFDGFLWTLASLTSAKAYQIQLVEA